MRYLGSKRFMLKRLIPILSNKSMDRPFVDLFCGSGIVVANSKHKMRYANDLDTNMVALLCAVLKGERFPDYISFETYKDCEKNPNNYSPQMVAFIGYSCGFGSKFFGGYSRSKENANYAKQGSNSLLKLKPLLKNIQFSSTSFENFKLPKQSVIYCDPPYGVKNTGYRLQDFDLDSFWLWASKVKNHLLYISSYKAPKQFICIDSIVKQTVHNNRLGGSFAVEKLFVNQETLYYLQK